MKMGDLLFLHAAAQHPCDMSGCHGDAVVYFLELGFCADCAGGIDAIRAEQKFDPVTWQEEPLQ